MSNAETMACTEKGKNLTGSDEVLKNSTHTTKLKPEAWEWHQLVIIHQQQASSLASARMYEEAHAHESRAKQIKEMLDVKN